MVKDTYLVDGLPSPEKESLQVERAALLDCLVEGREPLDLSLGNVFVEHKRKYREARVDGRVTQD